MFLVFNLLFQQSISRALQTSPSICTAGPTTPTLKSQNTVFPNCLHQIQKKPFTAHLQIGSEKPNQTKNSVSQEEKKKSVVFFTHRNPDTLFPSDIFISLLQRCSQGAARGDALLGVTSQQQSECWTLVIHPGVKQARGHHSLYSLSPWRWHGFGNFRGVDQDNSGVSAEHNTVPHLLLYLQSSTSDSFWKSSFSAVLLKEQFIC